ncbi:hypothetical protein ACH4MM_05350 [Streptomyces pratensis]|uniref:hypothetical protein n=1 Tax=Streptomyces pratensis TaxID=1169025 RepID=UPI0037B3BBC3
MPLSSFVELEGSFMELEGMSLLPVPGILTPGARGTLLLRPAGAGAFAVGGRADVSR